MTPRERLDHFRWRVASIRERRTDPPPADVTPTTLPAVSSPSIAPEALPWPTIA